MPSITGTSSAGRTGGTATGLSYSHTSNGDPLFVIIAATSLATSTWEWLEKGGVTFNGVDMFRAARVQTVALPAMSYQVWILPSPGSTTANVVISSAYGTLRDIVSVAHNINAPDLDGPVKNFAAAAQGGAGNTTPTINITSAVGDLVIDMVCSNVGSPQTFTEGGGQTNLVEQEVSGGNFKAASSSEAGAASVTMSWTLGTSDDWGICGFSVPATGTVANNDTRITQQGIHALTQKSVQFDPDVRVTQFGIHVVVQQTAAPTGGGPFLHYARLRGA